MSNFTDIKKGDRVALTRPNGDRAEFTADADGDDGVESETNWFDSHDWTVESIETPKPKFAPGWYASPHYPVSPDSRWAPYFVDESGDVFLATETGAPYSLGKASEFATPLVPIDTRPAWEPPRERFVAVRGSRYGYGILDRETDEIAPFITGGLEDVLETIHAAIADGRGRPFFWVRASAWGQDYEEVSE